MERSSDSAGNRAERSLQERCRAAGFGAGPHGALKRSEPQALPKPRLALFPAGLQRQLAWIGACVKVISTVS